MVRFEEPIPRFRSSFLECSIDIREQYGNGTVPLESCPLPFSQCRIVFDLAKSDSAYYYRQSTAGIEEAKKEAWRMYNNDASSVKPKLAALKHIIEESNEARFKLLLEGSSVLAIKSLERRLNEN